MLGAAAPTRAAWLAAYEAHNAAVVRFFRDELRQPKRLLVVDFASGGGGGSGGGGSGGGGRGGAPVWQRFCDFVEAWDTCPTGKPLPHLNPAQFDRHTGAVVPNAPDFVCGGGGGTNASAGSVSSRRPVARAGSAAARATIGVQASWFQARPLGGSRAGRSYRSATEAMLRSRGGG